MQVGVAQSMIDSFERSSLSDRSTDIDGEPFLGLSIDAVELVDGVAGV